MNRRKALGAAVAVVVVGVTVVAVVGPRESEPDEIDQLQQVLRLAPGSTVADVGAGDGWLSVEVARRVGPDGHVFATELNPARRDTIRETAAAAGLDSLLTVVEAGVRESNLPPACCDAIFMRRVYHHLGDPARINASLFDATRPGGRVAIIEVEPTGLFSPLKIWPHWTDDERVVAEMTAAGFRHVSTEPWPNAGHYVALFEKR